MAVAAEAATASSCACFPPSARGKLGQWVECKRHIAGAHVYQHKRTPLARAAKAQSVSVAAARIALKKLFLSPRRTSLHIRAMRPSSDLPPATSFRRYVIHFDTCAFISQKILFFLFPAFQLFP